VIGGAFTVVFAGCFNKDRSVIGVEDGRAADEAFDGIGPVLCTGLGRLAKAYKADEVETCHVVHEGCAFSVDTVGGGESDILYFGTVFRCVGSIVNFEVLGNKPDGLRPLVDGICVLGICGVAGEFGQARRKKEKVAVGPGVLVLVSIVEGIDLPSKAATASAVLQIKALGLCVPHIGCVVNPFCVLGFRKTDFRSGHCCESPTALVVVADGPGLIWRHEGIVVANLPLQCLGNSVVVLRIAGEIRVAKQAIPDSTGLPKVNFVIE
jgi:hypothetical protein